MKTEQRQTSHPRLLAATAIIFSVALCVSSTLCPSIGKEASAQDGDSSLLAGFPLSSSGATTYATYLKHYYDNLTSNFGMNYESSCGYVALGMLLSYYDAAFDEDIVPTAYDEISTGSSFNLISRRCSPGVLHDDFATTGFYNLYGHDFPGSNLYLAYCYTIYTYSLHAKLITIGASLGYVPTPQTNAFSTSASQRTAILNQYLQNVVGLSNTDYSISSYSIEANYYDGQQPLMTSAIVDLISSGHPVLVGIKNVGAGTGHAAIAYDYEYNPILNKYTIYYHPGLSHEGYSTHMTIDEMGYSLIRSYMTIDFNYNGIPDNNYSVTIGNNTNYYQYCSNSVNWEG